MAREIMAIAKCNKCGRMWDMNGCQVSGQGPFEVIEFTSHQCQEQGEQTR